MQSSGRTNQKHPGPVSKGLGLLPGPEEIDGPDGLGKDASQKAWPSIRPDPCARYDQGEHERPHITIYIPGPSNRVQNVCRTCLVLHVIGRSKYNVPCQAQQ